MLPQVSGCDGRRFALPSVAPQKFMPEPETDPYLEESWGFFGCSCPDCCPIDRVSVLLRSICHEFPSQHSSFERRNS